MTAAPEVPGDYLVQYRGDEYTFWTQANWDGVGWSDFDGATIPIHRVGAWAALPEVTT